MVKIIKKISVFFFVLIYTLGFAPSAFAHGDEPRLEISVDHVNPGGVVDVRGVDFEFEEVVTLMLVNSQTAIPFGEVVADTEGVFLQTITLPVDLAEGTYNFLAITDDHNITSPDLIVQGSPIYSSEQGGNREEEEPLLAPVPTFAPGVVPAGVIPSTTQPISVATESTSSQGPIAIILIAFLMIGFLLTLGLRVLRKG